MEATFPSKPKRAEAYSRLHIETHMMGIESYKSLVQNILHLLIEFLDFEVEMEINDLIHQSNNNLYPLYLSKPVLN